jgi:hypothetical protein
MELIAGVLIAVIKEVLWFAIFSPANNVSQDPAALAAEIRFSSVRSTEEYR